MNEESHRYDDIMGLPHHVSKKHPPMSMRDRAAQFAPFAALVGYEAAIDETARLTETRQELDESEQIMLDNRLRALADKLDEKPAVTIEHFVPDSRKQGGAYIRSTGRLAKVSQAARTLIFEDGRVIPIANITAIECDLFNGQDTLP